MSGAGTGNDTPNNRERIGHLETEIGELKTLIKKLTGSDSIPSADDAAFSISKNKNQRRKDFIREGKKTLHVIGYEAKPYYNRSKKLHLSKLIIVEKNELRGNIYRRIVAKNVKMEEAEKLKQLRFKENAKELLAKEHKERKTKMNYGFVNAKS